MSAMRPQFPIRIASWASCAARARPDQGRASRAGQALPPRRARRRRAPLPGRPGGLSAAVRPGRRREWDAAHAPGPMRAGGGPVPRPRAASGRWTREGPEVGTRRRERAAGRGGPASTPRGPAGPERTAPLPGRRPTRQPTMRARNRRMECVRSDPRPQPHLVRGRRAVVGGLPGPASHGGRRRHPAPIGGSAESDRGTCAHRRHSAGL